MRNLVLILISLIALSGLSPVPLQAFVLENGRLQARSLGNLGIETSARMPASDASPVLEADLDGDGWLDQVRLANSRVEIISRGNMQWASPSGWQVLQAAVTDLDQDVRPEVTLLVWRDFQPWPVDRFQPYGGRINGFQDERGQSCHLILIGWKRGRFGELWAGSALAKPLRDFVTADLAGDGRQMLVALEGDYHTARDAAAQALTVWEWNGFGFGLVDRVPGRWTSLSILSGLDGQAVVISGK